MDLAYEMRHRPSFLLLVHMGADPLSISADWLSEEIIPEVVTFMVEAREVLLEVHTQRPVDALTLVYLVGLLD